MSIPVLTSLDLQNVSKVLNSPNPSSGGDVVNLTYLNTQLGTKQNTITGGATTIVSSNLTASRALASDGSGKVAVSSVTSTELGYLSGVTSAIQTQIDGKAATSHTHAIANVTGLQTSLDAKAPLASPTFTGTPLAPTATIGTNTTQLATTAFVQTENKELLSTKRNLFHNGACMVWQRGASLSGSLSYVATMDGLYPYKNGGTGYSITVSKVDVGNTSNTISKNAARISYDSAGSGVSSVGTLIRFTAGHNIVGKNLVFSCKFRSNISGVTTGVFLYNNTTSATISNGYAFIAGSSVTPVSDETWREVRFAFPVQSNVSVLPTDKLSLFIFEKPVASTGYVEITDINVQVGATPTTFEIENYTDYLKRCQYFYEVVGYGSYGVYGTTTSISLAGNFQTEKWATPTISLGSGTMVFEQPGGSTDTITPSLSSGGSNKNGWFANIGGFSGKTVQQSSFSKSDLVIADTGF